MLQVVSVISGAPHILTVWELGRRGLLRIVAYDPSESMSYEVLLSKTERVCFGYDEEGYKSWGKDLTRRLSLRRSNPETISSAGRAASDEFLSPTKRTMILDKTIFTTTCRVAAGGANSCLLRVCASLIDKGNGLALDLYQSDTSKECRFRLNADDLAQLGSPPNVTSAEPLPPNTDAIGRGRRWEKLSEGACAEDTLMARILANADSREDAVRRLMHNLRFGDSDRITLLVQGVTRGCVMAFPGDAEQRRPQGSLRATSTSCTIPCVAQWSGLQACFLNQRRQPDVLFYGRDALQNAKEAKRTTSM